MRLLIIGGSYFFGRVYTMYAAENNEIVMFNRGSFPMNMENVLEVRGDRRRVDDLRSIPAGNYDAVVDFCGYAQGDIKLLVDNAPISFKQYIFVSTADVTRRVKYEDGLLKDETSDYETDVPDGEAGDYIRGKIALERELKSIASERGFSYTIIRPSVLYGPYNYAPRESEFVKMLLQTGRVFLPSGADMLYSLCYIKDAALMTLGITGCEKARDRIYYLAGEAATGERIADLLIEASGLDIRKEFYPENVLKQSGLSVPFGGTYEESQLYDGSAIAEDTGISYTPLNEGMPKTYRAFEGVFRQN